MKTLKFISGIILFFIIIYSGYYSTNNSKFVIWFGLITTILTPIAFYFILFPFKSKEKTLLKDLTRITQIEKLIEEANKTELKVQLLEKQKLDLEKLISFESHRRTLIAERNIYLYQGQTALNKIIEINENLELLTKERQALPEYLKSLQEEIRQKGVDDFIYVFRGKHYIVKKKNFEFIPIYGTLFYELFKSVAQIDNDFKKIR